MSSVCVLMVASGAPWESSALGLLSDRPGIVVLKRCVDVNDLLGAATAGRADVAVLALDAHGFDVAAVEHLRRHRVRPVTVTADPTSPGARSRAARLGLGAVVAEDDLASLADVVLDDRHAGPALGNGAGNGAGDGAADGAGDGDRAGDGAGDRAWGRPGGAGVDGDAAAPFAGGRTLAVWGPAGAPGRTTVALGIAAEIARRGEPAVVVDADPYGGSVAQQLGVMDEVSGLLSAARLSAAGELESRFPTVPRKVAPRLAVVTGLPRADRWVEIRPGTVAHLAEVAGAGAHVVLDTGFSLELEPGGELGSLPGRNSMTLGALDAADEIVVVGSADPVGLSRLARGLVELREHTHGAPVRVVVNRMRPTLGWSESEIAGMVQGFSRVLGLHFLPEDRAAVDRALISGRTLVEVGDSPLLRQLEELARAVVPALLPERGGGRLKRRAAGRAPRP